MNRDLQLLFEWLCVNRLSLNVAKTEFILFKPAGMKDYQQMTLKLNGKTLFPTSKVKYLGVYIDDKLTWRYHIAELCKTMGRSVGLLSKLRHYAPKSVLCSLYYSLIHSRLSYGCTVWSYAGQ